MEPSRFVGTGRVQQGLGPRRQLLDASAAGTEVLKSFMNLLSGGCGNKLQNRRPGFESCSPKRSGDCAGPEQACWRTGEDLCTLRLQPFRYRCSSWMTVACTAVMQDVSLYQSVSCWEAVPRLQPATMGGRLSQSQAQYLTGCLHGGRIHA
jgi:hypothetical protein